MLNRTESHPQATAAPRRARFAPAAARRAPVSPPASPRWSRWAVPSAAALTALALAATAQAAPLTVQSYSMVNGATGNYVGYGDNAYNGSNQGGFLSGGTGDLSNGVLGGDVTPGSSAWTPYVLWQNFNPTITFDLGSLQSVNQLSGHFAAYGRAAVYLPGAATLRFSVDGNSYFGETSFDLDVDHSAVGADEQYWLTLQTATQQARFVQVQWQRDAGRQWMALSEVQLANHLPVAGPNGVPEPASAALALAALGALAVTRRRRPG